MLFPGLSHNFFMINDEPAIAREPVSRLCQ